MSYVKEEFFHFLEQSPYFFDKVPCVLESEKLEGVEEGETISRMTYTFMVQSQSNQVIAEIDIPLNNPNADLKWKFLQLNEDLSRPTYQSHNPSLNIMPNWFRNLLLQAKLLYENKVCLFRMFSPAV